MLVSYIAPRLQLRLSYTTPLPSDYVFCPQAPETRSDVLDSSIPALLVHISNTYPILGVPSGEAGGAPGWGADYEIKQKKMNQAGV